MAKLTSKKRNALPESTFAGPDRSYPIPDASHARNALARASGNAGPALKAKIRAKVHKKFPGISIGKMHGGEVHHRMDKKRRGGSCKG
jgi:hypothetical protein